MKEFIDQLKFNIDGLIPAVAQQWDSGEILMMAWMSKQTLLKSLEQKKAIYYSRSRQTEWRKGDTSGNIQIIKEIRIDCDNDCILLLVTKKVQLVTKIPEVALQNCCLRQVLKITLKQHTQHLKLFENISQI